MRAPTYSRIAPPGSFIDQYMEYMADLETPLPYDFWSALWVLSSVVGRRCYVDRPSLPVFLNVYAILVAESGTTRKSTAVGRATKLLEKYTQTTDKDLIWLTTKTTPETIEAHLHEHSERTGAAQCVIAVSELVRFLGREKYNNALPGMLTDLYDCPDYQRSPGTLARGPTTIRNVYVTLFAACAPSWLVRSINPDVVEGGFTSRVVFVVANRRKQKVAWPAGRSFDASRLHDLLGNVDAQASRIPTLQVTNPAIKVLSDWYRTKPEHNDPFRSSFEAREDDHVLRIAGLLSINADRWQIEAADVRNAIKCVNAAKRDGASIFDEAGYGDAVAACIERLKQLFIDRGQEPLTQTEVYKVAKVHVNARKLRIILAVMQEMQFVQQFKQQRQAAGPSTKLWRGTDKLRHQRASELVAAEVNKR